MILKILSFLSIVKICDVVSANDDPPPVVQTLDGGVTGYYKESFGGNKYEAYEGIPYAQPPVGKLRFQPPEAVKPWSGNLTATKIPSVCIQYAHLPLDAVDKVRGSEDCLYLNVYATAKKSKQLVPVLFAIHGGGYQFGSAPTGVGFLMDRDIIVVSVGYRLGIFGFLSTEDDLVPGNMGLKDQSVALRWVADNIQAFGGDPKRITLVGSSAGAASVHYHYLSSWSKGLFQNGISLSGGAFGPGKHAENLREKTFKLASVVGCPKATISARDAIECLRSRPARAIAQATKQFMPWLYNPFTPFGPTIEKKSKKPFVDRSAIEIISSGDAYDVPWFTSLVSEEGLYPCAEVVNNDAYLKDLDKNWESIAPHLLDYNFTVPLEKHAEVARKIRNHYFGSKRIDRTTWRELVRCVGDRLYAVDGEKAARWMAKVNRSPVYFSLYSYRALTSFSDRMTGSNKNYGVSHSDDWNMIFVKPGSKGPTERPEDRLMQIKLIDWVTSVMETGTPKVGVNWQPVNASQSDLAYMHFAAPHELSMSGAANLAEKDFWSGIDFDENKLPGERKQQQQQAPRYYY